MAKQLSRFIRTLGQEDNHFLAAAVRPIDAGIGTDKAMTGLRDEDVWCLPNDPYGLHKDDLNVPSVESNPAGDLDRSWRRTHGSERDQPSFDLGNDLLRDHHDVALLE